MPKIDSGQFLAILLDSELIRDPFVSDSGSSPNQRLMSSESTKSFRFGPYLGRISPNLLERIRFWCIPCITKHISWQDLDSQACLKSRILRQVTPFGKMDIIGQIVRGFHLLRVSSCLIGQNLLQLFSIKTKHLHVQCSLVKNLECYSCSVWSKIKKVWGNFRDKYTNSTNVSDILFFVYVKNSPSFWKMWGLPGKNWGKSQSPALDQTLYLSKLLKIFSIKKEKGFANDMLNVISYICLS